MDLPTLLASDLIPLAALGVIALEGLVLLARRRRTGRGPAPRLVVRFLASGAALMAALYFHRRPDGVAGFGLAMTAALALHLWHLARLPRA
ncbi:MAG: hypothetical protein ACK53W_11215 [Gemmatimonadota bacterium]